jgi:signal transduction histidine kinase
VQQLLTLSRKNEPKLESVQVNTLIQRVANLIKETFPKTIEIDLKLARTLPPIMADQNQIAQVLLNLCVNARDAMQDGGRLTITTALAAESYVRIEVADTGVGIDESIQKQIFDPFFTTKAIGEGTGLGLAVVYGIVKNHKGLIRMQSAPSRGTAFSVYFPVESAEE